MALVLDGTNGVSGVDGTASNPAIEGTDSNTGIFYPAADTVAIGTGGTERTRVSSDGTFRVKGAGTAGSTDAVQFNGSAPASSMTLDASGRLGIGETTTAGYGRLQVKQPSADRYGAVLIASANDAFLQLGHTGTVGAVASTYGSTAGFTPLTFWTSDTERARITSDGYFFINATALPSGITAARFYLRQPSSDYSGVFYSTSSTAGQNYGLYLRYENASPNGTSNQFLICDDSAAKRAEIRSNGGIANFSANNVNLSDRREKTNFAPAKNYLDVICAIPVQTFNYIDQAEDDPGLTLGVVAQDVEAVAPELVMESNWGTKEEPKMRLSIYQTDLQYALMKSIQELKAIVDAQAAEIAALKGNA